MTKRPRFQFSLATLLLMLAWSGVVLGIIAKSRVDLLQFDGHEYWITYYGWPFVCAIDERTRVGPPIDYFSFVGPWCWRLLGDAVVGLLLVSMLTWGSRYLWVRFQHGVRCPQPPPVLATLARHYYVGSWYWRLVGDVAIVVLLVIVLAWGSTLLLRCVQRVCGRVE